MQLVQPTMVVGRLYSGATPQNCAHALGLRNSSRMYRMLTDTASIHHVRCQCCLTLYADGSLSAVLRATSWERKCGAEVNLMSAPQNRNWSPIGHYPELRANRG